MGSHCWGALTPALTAPPRHSWLLHRFCSYPAYLHILRIDPNRMDNVRWTLWLRCRGRPLPEQDAGTASCV